MTTTDTGPTPYEQPTKLRLSSFQRKALLDKAEGYRRGFSDAKAKDAALLEVARARHKRTCRVNGEHCCSLGNAIALAEGKE